MSKARAFDLILNLGVHAHLLEPPAPDESTTTDEYSQDEYVANGTQVSLDGNRKADHFKKSGNYSAIDKFENWILGILYEILLHLVQVCRIHNASKFVSGLIILQKRG